MKRESPKIASVEFLAPPNSYSGRLSPSAGMRMVPEENHAPHGLSRHAEPR